MARPDKSPIARPSREVLTATTQEQLGDVTTTVHINPTAHTKSKAKGVQRERSQQECLLIALGAARSHLRRDECGNWIISGRNGAIHTMGDDATWVSYITCRSRRHWTTTKQRLSFMTVSQDGDEEGCLRLAAFPTAEQAAILRDVVGLRKRREMTKEALDNLEKARAKSPVNGRSTASSGLTIA